MGNTIATIVKISQLSDSPRWTALVKDQIVKDLESCAIDSKPIKGLDVFALHTQLTDLLSSLSGMQRQNLIYRVDLPEVVQPLSEPDNKLAELVILRCFHKVWLRNTYS